jgi:hypothetical protein
MILDFSMKKKEMENKEFLAYGYFGGGFLLFGLFPILGVAYNSMSELIHIFSVDINNTGNTQIGERFSPRNHLIQVFDYKGKFSI